jgi:hypothetical protein
MPSVQGKIFIALAAPQARLDRIILITRTAWIDVDRLIYLNDHQFFPGEAHYEDLLLKLPSGGSNGGRHRQIPGRTK